METTDVEEITTERIANKTTITKTWVPVKSN